MQVSQCARCGTTLGPAQLDCPSCHTLVHAEQLKALAAEAEAAEASGRGADALATWQRVLALLPVGSRQHGQIADRVAALETKLPAQPPRADGRGLGRLGGGIAVMLGLWKLKAFVPTLATMALAFGAYWTAYGWQFAAGLVLSIWVHEMGHVIELRRRGVHASLPMFIPGLGAYVRLKQHISDPRIDARIGLAGPIAGALATVACAAVYAASGSALWLGLTQTGALINLFNLTPLLQLDGARAFASMSAAQRGLATLSLGAALFLTGNSLLWLPLLGAVLRLAGGKAPVDGDRPATAMFVALVAGLSALAVVPL